jgi:hypothetical protein
MKYRFKLCENKYMIKIIKEKNNEIFLLFSKNIVSITIIRIYYVSAFHIFV